MPEHSELKLPEHGVCLVCGAPLGGERHWITELPNGVHDRCKDWSTSPFPFERDLKRLWAKKREIKAAIQAVEEAGVGLRNLERRWPPRDAGEAVREGQALLKSLAIKM